VNTVSPVLSLIIGTYTEHLPHVRGKADGILTAAFDSATGRIGAVTPLVDARNPSFIALSASGENLYAVNETFRFDDQEGGAITAYARERRTGGLTRLNCQPSGGAAPCHLAIDSTGRFVLAANYGLESGSVSVYPIEEDGSLGALADHVEHGGSGPDPVRQTNSHAHMIASDPQTGDILVTDLGVDAVVAYTLGRDGGLTPKPAARFLSSPGAGPRHLVFHPDGKHLFVLNELDNTVLTMRRHRDHFEQTHVTPTLPANTAGLNLAAAIRVTPSGRHVLVSNRGHDSVALLRFDEGAATLGLTEIQSSLGEQPRDVALTPNGRHAIVANQDSDLLVSYEVDEDTPSLRLVHTAAAPTPACVVFG
jgi:6-phosphogluconolactonase